MINLRGIIVPIVDMRIKFKLGKASYDETTVMIILNVANRVVGIEQVNQAIMQMDVTQQNAALVEEAAPAAESIRNQAEVLAHAVSVFTLETAMKASRAALAKPIARSAIAHQTTKFLRKERKLIKAEGDRDGDWKEF